MKTVLLLIASNLFMTIAWYGHLRYKHVPLWQVILISWLIALPEYSLQVPANRWGHQQGFTGFQLKLLQEIVTFIVFIAFAIVYLREPIQWNYLVAMLFILGAVYFTFFINASATAGTTGHPT